jgi:NAD(P)-dependent dehydrogenase (short-subunit alcohol dehydrogenase family)
MQSIDGKIAWVTGAGTGIGRAGALALGGAGATVVLSGRRAAQLEDVAKQIREAGGTAEVEPLDIADAEAADAVVARIVDRHGRLDMLINSAGLNRPKRHWRDLSNEDWHTVVEVDLNGAFNVSHAAVKVMRKQRDGLIVNVSSMASQHIGGVSGIAYTAAKHGLNAMNESINFENCHLGIRACALCPGEVATDILDLRPSPPSKEDRARMVQEEDMGATILFIAQMPPHVCLNEIHITPTWNRGYLGAADRQIPRDD